MLPAVHGAAVLDCGRRARDAHTGMADDQWWRAVIPAYLYHDRDMYDVVIIGEIVAIAAIAVCLGFVVK